MKFHVASLALSAALGLVAVQEQPSRGPDAAPAEGGQPAAQVVREPDVRAITDLLASFVKAYNAKNATAISDLFTPDAEIEDDDGEVTKGREAIVARFAETLKEKAGTLAVKTESLRFLGTDVAIEEGVASITTDDDLVPHSNHYSVIYARQGGRWLHARIRDEPEEDTSTHERLRELSWLLGEWVNESDDEVVFTTCKWSKDGNYLLRDFDVKVEGRIALKGTQRITWDPRQEQFRMWVFDDSGGFADGVLTRDGDQWIVKGTGVRSDGQSVGFTTAITVLDKDRLRWEILERVVDGEVLSDRDMFELVRQAPNPGQ